MYRHILLCTDFGQHGKLIADKAGRLVKQLGAALYLVHVVAPIPTYGYSGSVDLQAISEDYAEKLLKSVAAELQVPFEQAFIATGSIKQEILDIAKKVQADLIILGTHGHHGLSHLVGSTANALSHSAPCDVLQIRLSED